MADRAKKISELSVLSSTNELDYIPIVDTHSNTTPTTKKITVGTLFGNVATVSAQAIIMMNTSTPANSTPAVVEGTIWADNNYLYVATANNLIKRVSLSTF